MAFTFNQYPILTPEQQNPWQAALTNAISSYAKGLDLQSKLLEPQIKKMELQYKPQLLEAEIFGKKFSPMAQLATSPAFMNDPELQENLKQLWRQQDMGGGFRQSSGMQGEEGFYGEPSGQSYSNKLVQEAIRGQELSRKLSKAGGLNRFLSGLAGTAESHLGDFGNFLTNTLTGGNVTPELSREGNEFEQILGQLKQNAILTRQLQPEEAERQYQQLPNETPEATMARIIKINPNLQYMIQRELENRENRGNEPEAGFKREFSEKTGIKSDNDLLMKAKGLSLDLEDAGYNIPENFIFDYAKKHKGKISVPALLKAAGIKQHD